MMTKHTAETQSSNSALHASKSAQEYRSWKKGNAEAEFGFDLLLNSATSAPNTNTHTRPSASGRHIAHKTRETSSESDPVQSTSRTNERSDKTAEQQKAGDTRELPPPKPETDTQDDALLAADPIFPTEESSLLLQAGMQISPQLSQTTTSLSEKQNSGDSAAVLPSKQETVNSIGTLQDAKALLSPEELSAELSQIEGDPGEKKASSTASSATLVPGNNEKTSADSRLHKIPDAQAEGSLNNLISSIKESNLSGTSTGEQLSLSIDNGDKQDVTSSLPKNTTLQDKADAAGMTNREAAVLQQAAQSAKSTPSTGETRSENMLSTMRSVPTPDLNDNKAHLIAAGNRLAVTLEPEGLGKLNINLSLDRGMVNAQIQVSDPAAKTLLENNMQQILDTLTHEGLTVGGFSVSLKQGEAGNSTGEQDIHGFLKSSEQIPTNTNGNCSFDHGNRVNIFV